MEQYVLCKYKTFGGDDQIHASPLIHNGILYNIYGETDISAWNFETGEMLWSVSFKHRDYFPDPNGYPENDQYYMEFYKLFIFDNHLIASDHSYLFKLS